MTVKAVASVVAGALAMLVPMLVPMLHLGATVLARSTPYFLLALTVVIMAWAGRHFYVNAWKALMHHSANMDSLVAAGTGAAFLYSVIATLAPGVFTATASSPTSISSR